MNANDPRIAWAVNRIGRGELVEEERKCTSCGEPETGEFGWFDDADNQTVCMRCGTVQK